jgi:hypothetical protein
MNPNPGGRLALQDIVGRTREITTYWRVLQRQSLILGAERRLGKSHIVWKMQGQVLPGFLVFYQDLEAIHSVLELVRTVYRTVGPRLSGFGKLKAKAIAGWTTLVPQRIGALDLPEAQKNWKSLLRTAIRDVLEVVPPNDKVVLIWDEFPLMLYNLARKEAADVAIELLDVLRELRQYHADKLRFIFTGSIGLHLVLRELHAKGNANDATNDMHSESVPPMRTEEALEVARRALDSLDPAPLDATSLAQRTVEQVGGYPYFIHHVVDRLCRLDSPASLKDVDDAVDLLVDDPADPAHLSYFFTRIGIYYRSSEAPIARALLDSIAASDTALDFEAVVNFARHRLAELSDEDARACLLLLRQDHYLHFVGSAYDFRWGILKRWWRKNRP